MRTMRTRPLLRLGAMLALASALAACTKGGQFDPTTILDNDMFDSKKPLTGQREPVFPNGVPGATTGIPADLYRGYQPAPGQNVTDTGSAAVTPIAPTVGEPPKQEPVKQEAEVKPKPKPKPKPKVARAPPPPRTQISIGLAKKPAQPAQTDWPAPPSNGAPQGSQSPWPAPQQAAQPAQTNWPAPPPTGTAQGTAQGPQTIWPNPPPPSSQ